jgi:hypothetical protein
MRLNGLYIVLILGLTTGTEGFSEPLKKGRVMCEGAECSSRDIPTGSLNPVGDLLDRVARRINDPQSLVTATPALATVPNKKKFNSADHVRISSAAPMPEGALPGEESNLPRYYANVDRSEVEASEKVVYVPKASPPKIEGLKSGDVIWAVVEQELVASPSVPTPVRAIAVGGRYKGGIFLGEATLDRELKRVLLSFTKLRLKDRDEVFQLKASGLSPEGSVGLEGEYSSQAGKFFVAELASAAAAGMVDATINRSQTTQGGYVQEPSLSNAGKTAAVSALSKTTERMAEGARGAPEFTKVSGYQEIQVIVQEDPVQSGN